MKELLTCHLDLEQLVLGYALKGVGPIDEMRSTLCEDDFTIEPHRLIWRQIVAIYDSGRLVDRVMVFQALQARGEGQSIGGLSFLVSLDEGLPDRVCIEGYIERLKDATTRRRIIRVAHSLMNRAADESEDTETVLSSLSSAAADIVSAGSGEGRPISTREMITSEGIDHLLAPRHRDGIRLPWARLDDALGGLTAGQMVVLMAATSRGKTSFALQVATAAAAQSYTPVIWTMEMNPRSLFQRLTTQLSGVYFAKRSMTFEERESLSAARIALTDDPVFMDYRSRSVGAFVASMRQVKARGRLGLGVVDYLQLIRGSRGKNRNQEVSENSRALKLAAADLGIPLLVLSQVDRTSVKGEGRIGLHSAKESGDVENDADVVLWIEAGEFSRDADTTVSMHVGKQREGPAGFSIPMVFRPSLQTFNEVAQ